MREIGTPQSDSIMRKRKSATKNRHGTSSFDHPTRDGNA